MWSITRSSGRSISTTRTASPSRRRGGCATRPRGRWTTRTAACSPTPSRWPPCASFRLAGSAGCRRPTWSERAPGPSGGPGCSSRARGARLHVAPLRARGHCALRWPPMTDFPHGFLWGTATAAHQIEGGNVNNDWWAWEHNPASGCAASSSDACDSWHRWREDVDLVADLGLNAYRFSLEWSRIEPAEGEWSGVALDHYRRVCAACLERGIAPVVTFHHFTTPLWLAGRGGWESPDAPDRFGRFVSRAVAHLGDVIGRACTINELNVVGVMGYMVGDFPPGVKRSEEH